MKKITSIEELRESILLLEAQQETDGAALKEQFKTTYEQMKPINFIKNTLKELVTEPNLRGDLLNATLGLAAGYLSKKAAVGSTTNPFKQILGTLLQMGVTKIVSKNADGIKSTASSIISSLFGKKESSSQNDNGTIRS